MSDSFLSSPFLYNLSLTLIHFLWQGVFIALVLKLLLSITSHKKSQLRYTLATVAMVLNLALPLITFFVIYQPEAQSFAPALRDSFLFIENTGVNQQYSNVWYSDTIEFLPYISIVWIVISFSLALKLVLELYSVHQLPKVGVIEPQAALKQRFEQLAKQIKLKRTPNILISLKSSVPMAIGWFKPVVLIPASMLTGLTPAQLDMLILHELAHIRRHDYLVNFIQTLVEILLFFHPSVRWVSKQMRNEREYCSDDIAVQHCGNPIAYAHTLADTANICHKHRHSIPNMAMAASGGDLKQRVVRLVDHEHHCSSNDNSSKWFASIAIILAMLVVSSKKYIQLPVLDISSGTISLYRTANESLNNFNETMTQGNLPESSLAQQLLNQDKIDALTPTIELAIPKEPKKSPLNVDITRESTSPQLNSQSTITQAPESVSSNKKEITLNSQLAKTSTINSTSIKGEVPTSVQSIELPTQTVKELVVSKVNNEIEKNRYEKSMSEEAFERTNSKNSLAFGNPYAQEIAALSQPVKQQSSLDEVQAQQFLSANDFSTIKVAHSFNNTLSKNTVNNRPLTEVKAVKTSPKLLNSVEPKYPNNAKRKGIELEVKVNFVIDKSGRVRDIQYKSKGKVNYFRSSIRNAMEKWRFEPATIDGQPVKSTMAKIFSFSILK